MFGSSPIRFTCRSCGNKLQAAANLVGAEEDCPACGSLFVVPSRIGELTRSIVANGLTIIGILALVSFTSGAIERVRHEREIQSKDSLNAGSADIAKAAAAGDPESPQPTAPELDITNAQLPLASVELARQIPQAEAATSPSQKQAFTTDEKTQVDKIVKDKPADSRSNDPFAPASDRRVLATAPTDLEVAKAELEAVTGQIDSERQRWKDALDVINQLTANKTRPVREGSPDHRRCMEASKIIQEVESGAAALKARKARLENRIQELGK